MKKSVVAIAQVLLSSCHTAASSPVSTPTRSCLKGVAGDWPERSCCNTDGASLHPHPPPCARLVSRICGTFIDALPRSYAFACLQPLPISESDWCAVGRSDSPSLSSFGLDARPKRGLTQRPLRHPASWRVRVTGGQHRVPPQTVCPGPSGWAKPHLFRRDRRNRWRRG